MIIETMPWPVESCVIRSVGLFLRQHFAGPPGSKGCITQLNQLVETNYRGLI